jgi:hypothetical protein
MERRNWTMIKISLVALLFVATQGIGFSQGTATNGVSTAVQSILGSFLQVTNASSPSFGIFAAADDVTHVYARNRAPMFVGNAVGGTGVDLTAIPVFSNWDSPPPTGGNPYGGARFNGILVAPDILLQAHHPWSGSGYAPKTMYFVDNSNRTVAGTVSGHQQVSGTDTEVVRLTKNVPSSITPALVFATGSFGHDSARNGTTLHGIPVLWTDQFRELYIGIGAVAGSSAVVVFQASEVTPFHAYWGTGRGGVISGDSGAPFLTVINGRLVAMGTWSSGGSTRGAGSSFESQVSAIDAAIKALGSTTTVETVNANVFP